MNTNQIPTLPALRTLGNLADVRPTIITDTREQTPLVFTNLVTVAGTLTSGDYAPRGLEHLAAIERKSAADSAEVGSRPGAIGPGRRQPLTFYPDSRPFNALNFGFRVEFTPAL